MKASEGRAEKADKSRKRRFGFWRIFRWTLLVLLLAAWGFYVWTPWVIEIFPRAVPNPNPPVDPESKRFWSKETRILIVTAHPDDPEFYVGGTLLKLGRSGAKITLVCCTDGDKAYYPFEDYESNRRIRQAEQRRALAAWKGEKVVFLGFPDGRLKANEQVIEKLSQQIREVKPDYIFTFDSLYPPRFSHSDHRQAGEAMLQAARRTRFQGWMMLFSTRAPNFVDDISKEWPEKKNLLAIHKSQFYGEKLKRIERMVEGFAGGDGKIIGVTHGEGFRCVKFNK